MDIEVILFYVNLVKTRWFLLGCYNSSKQIIPEFLNHVSKNLEEGMENDDNCLLFGNHSDMIYVCKHCIQSIKSFWFCTKELHYEIYAVKISDSLRFVHVLKSVTSKDGNGVWFSYGSLLEFGLVMDLCWNWWKDVTFV